MYKCLVILIRHWIEIGAVKLARQELTARSPLPVNYRRQVIQVYYIAYLSIIYLLALGKYFVMLALIGYIRLVARWIQGLTSR